MKQLILIIILSFVYQANSSAQQHESFEETGIQFFEDSYNEALELAKKENKLIFLDVYATWCGPCKALKKNSFPNKAVGDFFNANFINISIDGEKGEGIDVARLHRVRAYPSMFVLDANGDILLSYAGYLGPEDLLEFGKTAKEQANKQK